MGIGIGIGVDIGIDIGIGVDIGVDDIAGAGGTAGSAGASPSASRSATLARWNANASGIRAERSPCRIATPVSAGPTNSIPSSARLRSSERITRSCASRSK